MKIGVSKMSEISAILIIAVFLFSLSIPIISAENIHSKTLVKNVIHVPGDYPTIQDAINHSVNGDITVVADGIYVENIVINKSITLIL